ANPPEWRIPCQQQGNDEPAHFALEVAALKVAQAFLRLGRRGTSTISASGGAAARPREPTEPAAAPTPEVAATDLGREFRAVEDLGAVERGSTSAQGQRLVPPELVGQLQKDLGITFKIEIAVRSACGPVDLQSLDSCKLVFPTQRLAGVGKDCSGIPFFRLLGGVPRLVLK